MFNQLAENNFLAKIDIFSLLGLFAMPDDQKRLLLSQMMEIVVNDFLKTEALRILGDKDIEEIETLKKSNAPVEEIIKVIKEKIPDIEDRLFEKTLTFKKEFAKNHLRLRLEINKKRQHLLAKGKYPKERILKEEKTKIQKALKKEEASLIKALNFYGQERWQEGLAVLKNSPS